MTPAQATPAAERVFTPHDPPSQTELAVAMGIHRVTCLLIEHRALRKLRAAIEREAEEAGVTPLAWLLGE